MFYDRANSNGASSDDKIPQSVLLFGDCKWDNRLKTLPSYSADDMLLIYETENSEFTTASTGVDDFITILGDRLTVHDSGTSSSNLRFDMGVGRLCVSTLAQATQMVDKIVLLLRGLRSSLCRLSISLLLDCSVLMTAGFPPAEQGAFYALTSEVIHYHLNCILLVTQTSPDSMWEETRST
jgi:hypothetical protein